MYAQGGRDVRRRREGTNKPPVTEVKPETTTVKPAEAGFIISGKVLDAADGTTLPGAYIKLKETMQGTLTNDNGDFKLRVATENSVEVVINYIGYTTRTLTLRPGPTPITIQLKEGSLTTEEVVVSASRVSEKLKETSASITKLTLTDLRNASTLNLYEAISTTKELDGVSVGIGYKVYNARGFLAVINNRFSQRYDGVEFLTPGSNASAGNLLAPPDMDIENAEIVVGSASALYGPSAVNGLLNLRTRSPFDYTGVSFTTRIGINHINSPSFSPKLLGEVGFRYGRKVSEKFAYKFSFSGFRATDWVGDNNADGANYLGTTNTLFAPPGPGNAGYDGTNIFGDGNAFIFSYLNFQFLNPAPNPISPADLIRVGRTGYREEDLTDYNFYNYKFSAALHYRFKPRHELVVGSNITNTTALTPFIQRDKINNFWFHQHRVEVTGPSYFVRAYTSLQANTSLVSMQAVGSSLNRIYKGNEDWFTQYLYIYGTTTANNDINSALGIVRPGWVPLPVGNDAAARQFADSDNSDLAAYLTGIGDPRAIYFLGGSRLLPNTPVFDSTISVLRNTYSTNAVTANSNGSRFADYTGLGHVEGQYDFSEKLKNLPIQVGGSVRYYSISSNGTFYTDLPGSSRSTYEYGAYFQIGRQFFDERFKISASVRVDGNQFVTPQVSPRVSLTFSMDRNRRGFLRASFQRANRLPTVLQQFQQTDLGTFQQLSSQILVSEQSAFAQNLAQFNYTLESFRRYVNSEISNMPNPSILTTFPFKALQPEVINAFELGFRTTMDPGGTYIDLAVFYNDYTNFIGLVPLIGPRFNPDGTLVSPFTIQNLFRFGNVANYQVWANLPDKFSSFGYSLSLTSTLGDNWTTNGSFSYIQFLQPPNTTNVGLVDAYNTPAYKSNITLNGRNFLFKNLSVGLVHRWVDAYQFQVPNFNGFIPAFNVMDASISYDFTKAGLQLKLGGTNILNHRHVEVTFGPTIGSVFFLQLSYDPILFKRR